MAHLTNDDNQIAPHFPTESVKIIGESIGISSISDDVAKELSEEATYKLKLLIQDARKFTLHGKRKKMAAGDFDHVLKMKNIEPLNGIYSNEHIPFRFASGGGRELHFLEDKEIEIGEVVASQVPRLPLQVALKPHWLAIDGVQPTIPENPPPVTKDAQKNYSVDPAAKIAAPKDEKDQKIHGRGMKSLETVKVKQLATHELSSEQQLYYKEITEACVGSDEPRRAEALHSLAFDPGLHQMVPRLCTFISEGVRVNVVQKNLALLIYLMRMAKALLDNQTLYLEKYLHELTPAIMTCIVSKQLCMKPDMDNHWALRDFAARLIAQVCRNFNTTTNCLQTRITRVFTVSLNLDKNPLSTVYGAIAGLSELGTEVTKAFIIPKLRILSDKIEQCLDGINHFDKTAASHMKTILLKTVAPVLKVTRNPPDSVEDYKSAYGYLGPQLQMAVLKARQAPPAASSAQITATANPAGPPLRAITTSTTRIIQQGVGSLGGGLGARTVVVNKAGTGSMPPQPSGAQKVIIMTSRPATPSQGGAVSESLGGVMKSSVVTPGGVSTAGGATTGMMMQAPQTGTTGGIVVSGGPSVAAASLVGSSQLMMKSSSTFSSLSGGQPGTSGSSVGAGSISASTAGSTATTGGGTPKFVLVTGQQQQQQIKQEFNIKQEDQVSTIDPLQQQQQPMDFI